jgi:hypothetical protein
VDPRALGAGVPQDEQKRKFADSSTPQDEQYPITFASNSLLQTPRVRPPRHLVFLEVIENRLPAFATEQTQGKRPLLLDPERSFEAL